MSKLIEFSNRSSLCPCWCRRYCQGANNTYLYHRPEWSPGSKQTVVTSARMSEKEMPALAPTATCEVPFCMSLRRIFIPCRLRTSQVFYMIGGFTGNVQDNWVCVSKHTGMWSWGWIGAESFTILFDDAVSRGICEATSDVGWRYFTEYRSMKLQFIEPNRVI